MKKVPKTRCIRCGSDSYPGCPFCGDCFEEATTDEITKAFDAIQNNEVVRMYWSREIDVIGNEFIVETAKKYD